MHVYLVVDYRHGTSAFVSEIQRDGYEIDVVGNNGEDPNCPLCETGKIVLRKGKYGEFHSCSNYPYCEYKER
jgi:DNA helicase-4